MQTTVLKTLLMEWRFRTEKITPKTMHRLYALHQLEVAIGSEGATTDLS